MRGCSKLLKFLIAGFVLVLLRFLQEIFSSFARPAGVRDFSFSCCERCREQIYQFRAQREVPE